MLDLSQTRRAPTWLVVAVVGSVYPWSWFVNQWFAANGHHERLLHASAGLISPSLQVCLPTVILFLLATRVAGLRLADVGWRGRDLFAGTIATLGVWLLCHAVIAIVDAGRLAFDASVTAAPILAAGGWMGQLFGNAMYEETVYRGFCLVQFLLILRARRFGPKRAAWLAALLSALVFALPHIPNRILKHDYHGFGDVMFDQARLLCSGMFLAWIYYRTRNLWWVIGLHSLANHPTLLLEWRLGASTKEAVAVLGLGVTIAWPWVFHRGAGKDGES